MNENPVKRIKRGWMSLRVIEVRQENHNTKTLIFQDADDGGRPFDYLAGQYLTFRFDGLGQKPIVRSYTMSSSPCQGDTFAITVKEIDDAYVSHFLIADVAVGDVLRARGPIGGFTYRPDKDAPRLCMIAAGSGVTPFVSIMREEAPHLGKMGHPNFLYLLVGYRSRQDLICWDELQAMQKQPGIHVTATLSREHAEAEGFDHGHIDVALLAGKLPQDLTGTTFMLCGPQVMMTLVAEYLQGRGVESSFIRTESFAS